MKTERMMEGMDTAVLWVSGGVLLALWLVQKLYGRKRALLHTCTSMLLGWAVLALVNLCGRFTGVNIPVTPLSIGVSGAAGIPGVTALLLLDLLW